MILSYSTSQTLTERRILDISKLCLSKFAGEYIPTEDQGGFTLEYENDSDDGYFSEAVPELTEKTLVATVATILALGNLNIGRQLTTDDIAFVTAENMYYVLADATTTPMLWSAYAEGLHPLVSGNGNRTFSLGAGILATYTEMDDNTGLTKRFNKLCSRQTGCYINNRNVLVKSPFALRFFFIKKQAIGTNIYPLSFNHNTSPTGGQLVATSLALQGPTSLGARHAIWQAIKSHPEKYKLDLVADRKLLNDLATHNLLMLNNVLMIPTMIYQDIPLQDTLKVDAVPL